MKNAILWKGSGWYALRRGSARFEKVRQDRVGDLRERGVPCEFFSAPPLNWAITSPETAGNLSTDKNFIPGETVRVITYGEDREGEIVKPGNMPSTWVVALPISKGKPGIGRDETVHERFIYKITEAQPEDIDD